MKKAVSVLGEFGLIEKIFRKINAREKRKNIIVGPGDDAFVGKLTRGFSIVGTVDLLVEDVHFKKKWASPYEIGYKAMAVNLSDIAAMGAARPLFALAGIALGGNTSAEFVEGLYIGMQAACSKHGCIIAGGDTVSSKGGVTISVSIIGEAREGKILKRSGAAPGDFVACINTFGDSGAGLEILRGGKKAARTFEKYLVKKHLLPEPRFKEAEVLAQSGFATTLIDASDGLAVSLNLLSEASGVGMDISLENIPLSKELKSYAKYKNRGAFKYALYGGEDYELVFTVKSSQASKLLKLIPNASLIGRVSEKTGVRYLSSGKKVKIAGSAYEHFK